jgi:hypothetical protein
VAAEAHDDLRPKHPRGSMLVVLRGMHCVTSSSPTAEAYDGVTHFC